MVPIALMPGHGGLDSGATWGDLVEKDLVYNHAVAIKSLLLKKGFECHIISSETRNKRKRAYSSRIDECNSLGAIGLSLHLNAGNGNYSLVEYATNNSQSIHLAEHLIEEYRRCFSTLISSTKILSLNKGDRGLACINGCKRSGVLCEPLFIDNPAHANWLRRHDNRLKWAEAVVSAIVQFKIKELRI